MRYLLTIFLLIFIVSSAVSQKAVVIQAEASNPLQHVTTLDAQWRVREFEHRMSRNGSWIEARVPGCVHTDLIRAGRIDHPFYGTNENDCQWVGERDWQYETLPFDVPDSIFNKTVIQWKFHGLDTYARVELNGVNILESDNAHRSWVVEVKPHLIKSGNVLRITFTSAVKRAQELLVAVPYPLPGDSLRSVVRKPQFHFGWDWGPKLITCGITRHIEWVASDEARLADYYFKQSEVNEQLAEMQFKAHVIAAKSDTLVVRVKGKTSGGTWSEEFFAVEGSNDVFFPIRIHTPQLWWCNGQGRSNLYAFEIEVLKNGKVIQHTEELIGLRDLRLITERDSIGESFYFQLNGQPVFVKGANYIPIRYFPGEATYDDYLKLIWQCKDAGINMLRVWGGGLYEEEVFYDLCDQYGIMIWQDFMYACSMYPGNQTFLDNVKSEAVEQTQRLRNHPCIALWCGNNENAEGWERWGWKAGLTQPQVDSVQQAYDRLFKKILPEAVSQNTTTRYWESSPRWGRGDARSINEGDSHYWGLWHDGEPFEVLQTKVPRFMSEFGMQSYPSQEVIEEMLEEEEVSISDEGIVQHQKHSRGFALMDQYMNNWYPPVSRDEVELYGMMTQAVQAEGMAMGIEAQRRAMPRCMGTMYWQLNDVWPSFSWSSIDYKGAPKLMYDYVKTVYAPQLISTTMDGDELQIWWISDTRIDSDSMQLDYAIYDGSTFKGEPNPQIRSTNEALYQSPVLGCRIGYGAMQVHSIALEDLGIDSPENLIIEARISYPGQANPQYKRIQKLIAKSSKAIIPYRVNYKSFDPKTRNTTDSSTILFKAAY